MNRDDWIFLAGLYACAFQVYNSVAGVPFWRFLLASAVMAAAIYNGYRVQTRRGA